MARSRTGRRWHAVQGSKSVKTLSLFWLGTALFALGMSRTAAATSCTDLAGLQLQDTTITTAAVVPAGSFTPTGATAPITNLPEFCRVAGVIAPTPDSSIGFEVWLPTGWNGRYLQSGNGGFAGAIPYTALGKGIARGYATAGTDDGHQAGGRDASWALGDPEKIIDFGYRSLHLTALRSKEVVAAFYQAAPRRSYFEGCSDGGRESLMEAQRYPDDFDGWVVGAPAYNWTNLLTAHAWNQQAVAADRASALTPEALQTLSQAVIARCDARDGVVDGIISTPQRCSPRPRDLVCQADETANCLTPSQAEAAEAIYAGAVTPETGRIYPGWPAGHEAEPGNWPAWITGPDAAQLAFSTNFFAYMVYDNPSLSVSSINIADAFQAAEARVGPILNSTDTDTDTDLGRIRAGGKKIIHYHGWADAAISTRGSIDYYRNVATRLGRANQDFYRLFLLPGMGHCTGGPGPNNIGQLSAPAGSLADPEHNVLGALQRWVEDGVAPDSIIATKYASDDPAQTVLRTRPICPYPQEAEYKGDGSTDDAANFICVRR
ncbi:tannase/feruloyl esterase family alpha/beta hydrolase [Paracraurococcus lichenis]|uniref:Tannase/feruloyl esterase family alpha/beta hydrolase n=1 Tax=Paracraurococcus lichenis TaxID=3064888 RepID=A0ABT9E9B9_9PROT|nr:tannase/feruloyl esterase family alpha/beta hydrolase [Paracraurococcus sp. LOR1-02]MDO9712694.1 tannase/feruloyl esterase family alpha/beta hydrolase [Paracraurococcus sp. LOR1-02]